MPDTYDALLKRLDEIQARADAATPGEWLAAQMIAPNQPFNLDDMETTTSFVAALMPFTNDDGGTPTVKIADPIISADDAEFIANSRADVPALVDAARDLISERDNLIETVNALRNLLDEARIRAAEAEAVIRRVCDIYDRWVIEDDFDTVTAIESIDMLIHSIDRCTALAEVKAQAWDEGWEVAMHADAGDYAAAAAPIPSNPYRQEAGE